MPWSDQPTILHDVLLPPECYFWNGDDVSRHLKFASEAKELLRKMLEAVQTYPTADVARAHEQDMRAVLSLL